MKRSIEELKTSVHEHLPTGWNAYVSCYISFSSMDTTPDFISGTRDSRDLQAALKAESNPTMRKEIRNRWLLATREQAKIIAANLKAKGFKAHPDYSQVVVHQ